MKPQTPKPATVRKYEKTDNEITLVCGVDCGCVDESLCLFNKSSYMEPVTPPHPTEPQEQQSAVAYEIAEAHNAVDKYGVPEPETLEAMEEYARKCVEATLKSAMDRAAIQVPAQFELTVRSSIINTPIILL